MSTLPGSKLTDSQAYDVEDVHSPLIFLRTALKSCSFYIYFLYIFILGFRSHFHDKKFQDFIIEEFKK